MANRHYPSCMTYGLLSIASLLLVNNTSCNEIDDSYSTRPEHRLSFSADTLSFDTVFTAIGSATRQIMVYNTNKDPLLIETVRIANSRESGFRLNVDGRSGEVFSNIPIAAKDSLFVWVEVTVEPTQENLPLLIEDLLEFTVNGNTQAIRLQACGQNVHLLKGGVTLTCDTLWTAERPYLIYDSLAVDSGVVLTIEKGASLYMHSKAKWIINGTLHANGTLSEPIVFRGDRLDNLLSNLPYDRIANQWDGLFFGSSSYGNTMNHVVVRNANRGLYFFASRPEQMKITIANSQVTNMEQCILNAVNCRIEAVNTEFSNAGGNILSLTGGNYQLIHCTLANYYTLNPGRRGLPALELKANGDMPLDATFDNCIIDGSYSEGDQPLKGELSVNNPENGRLSFLFNHCAVKTMAVEDSAFTHVQFIHKENPVRYKYTGSAQDNLFDFRPDTCRALTGQADPDIAARYPLDRFGIDRTSGKDGPDIGAYEYTPDPPAEEEKKLTGQQPA